MILLPSQISEQISRWYQMPANQELLNQTYDKVSLWLSDSVGYYALTASYFDDHQDYFKKGHIRSRFLVTPTVIEKSDTACNFEELPFETESVDSAVAHHIFEFSDNPYAVMRELHRILIPGGNCIIIAFNPLGIYGLVNLFKSKYSIPLGGTFFSMMRIRDWLSLLDFEVTQSEYIAPLGFYFTKVKKRFSWFPELCGRYMPITGGLFVINATKKVVRPIVKKEEWEKVSPFIKNKVMQPTTLSER